jgi:hypothetical protein
MGLSLEEQLKKIAQKINADIEKVLEKEVASAVIEVGKEKVEEVVYDAYISGSTSPDKYIRTGKLKEEWDSEIVNDGVLEVSPARQDGNRYIPEIIELGQEHSLQGYEFPYLPRESKGDFREPRPFVEETRKELVRTNKHKEALKDGLNKRGYVIE